MLKGKISIQLFGLFSTNKGEQNAGQTVMSGLFNLIIILIQIPSLLFDFYDYLNKHRGSRERTHQDKGSTHISFDLS